MATKYIEKKCPSCGQRLRVPEEVGGVLMECPSCGQKLHSDFKIKGVPSKTSLQKTSYQKNIFMTIFELPYTTWQYLKRKYFS